MAAPPLRAWNELSVHPKLCVGTARRALSKVHETLMKEMDSLKKEGQSVSQSHLDSALVTVGMLFICICFV